MECEIVFYVPVILGSIRRNRESIKVAKFAVRSLRERSTANTELLDLKELNLPMMEERLRYREDISPSLFEFSTKVRKASSILIVTPEYSGGYPGVLKNALDYLKPECSRKAFGIITVSAAMTGGVLCLNSLRQVILHLGGVPIPASLPVAMVREAFDWDGNPIDPAFHQRAKVFFDEFLWFTECLGDKRAKPAFGD